MLKFISNTNNYFLFSYTNQKEKKITNETSETKYNWELLNYEKAPYEKQASFHLQLVDCKTIDEFENLKTLTITL